MCCLDVQVMRGPNCWTDHHMVRGYCYPRVEVYRSNPYPPLSIGWLAWSLVICMRDLWSRVWQIVACLPEEHWDQFKSSIVSSSEGLIGRGYCSSPEWFEDNVNLLRPLNDKKNEALQKWTANVPSTDRSRRSRRLSIRPRKSGLQK